MNLIGSWDLESKGIFIPVREAQQLSPRPASRQISDGFECPVEFKQAGKTAEMPRKRSDKSGQKVHSQSMSQSGQRKEGQMVEAKELHATDMTGSSLDLPFFHFNLPLSTAPHIFN